MRRLAKIALSRPFFSEALYFCPRVRFLRRVQNLIYTHSKAGYDDKPSYLHKVGTRYFAYLEITHRADRILVVDGAALVTGRMTANVSVEGTIVHVDNRYLAVCVREQGAWKFVAYQPTPIIKT
jgi:hypothetical protein